MDIIENIRTLLENYNALIKYQIKANREKIAGERKINLPIDEVFFDYDSFKSSVLNILDNGVYTDEFINSINRLYFLSEANSDLLVEYNSAIKNIYRNYPIAKDLDKLSLDIFHFIHFDILQVKDEFGRRVFYKCFENLEPSLPECRFKDNPYILWELYYFSLNISEAYLKQELTDLRNLLAFKEKSDGSAFTKHQKDKRLEQIFDLAKDFCNRDLPFLFLKENPPINQTNMVCLILSDMLEKLSTEDYAKYIEFDYSKYNNRFIWEFEKKSISDYTDIAALPKFDRLIYLLGNIFYIKKVSKEFARNETTETIPTPNDTLKESVIETEPQNKTKKAEYLLPVPILNLIYEEFNGELWETISLVDFLNTLTTAINFQDNFKIRQKTRFYYLLKKICINSPNLSLFNTEKEWSETFLNKYNLSVSAYWNQTVRNEGSLKNRVFVQSVDKILTKDERFK